MQFDIKKSQIPTHLSPQLATLVDKPPAEQGWIHELKFDGYRIIAFKEGNIIRLVSRNDKNWTSKFPNIVHELKKIPYKNLILDGEIVILDSEGKSNFQLLQNFFKSSKNANYIYYIFDLLYFENYDLRSLPLYKRKGTLKEILDSENSSLRFSAHIEGKGNKIFEPVCEMDLEGIVSKLSTSPYKGKRTKTWLKFKCIKRQEFVIGGFLPPQGSRKYFGSLYLGVYEKNGQLKFCGKVGTGFNQKSLKDIYTKLLPLKTTKNPFSQRPPGITKAIWVKPNLVAEIEFKEWTRKGTLRHPSFRGLRYDKPATKIIREKEVNLEVVKEDLQKKATVKYRLTHPNKIIYPEDKITKADLAHYYETVSDFILPHIKNRPLTLVRCPESYKKCFYQKHLSAIPKSLLSISVKDNNKEEKYIYLNDKSGLMVLVQMGVLEIHPWGSNIHNIEKPNLVVFDLDPAPDVKWKEVVAAAHLIKKYLLYLHLKSFVKTTGGKGLHVVVPILADYSWKEIKNFTHRFVNALVKTNPTKYIGKMAKSKRSGKIFIDYLRNAKGATSVAPYSTRSRLHAPVSVPLDWDELTPNFKDTFFNIFNLPKRLESLKNDPWAGFADEHQRLDLTILDKE